MKLKLKEPFTLEVGEDTYSGELVSLTKKQLAKINKISPNKDIKEVQKISKYLDITREIQPHLEKKEEILAGLDAIKQYESEIEALNERIDAFDIEDIYKARMETSIMGEDKRTIMDLGEMYGYKKVFATINEDIKEQNEKN